MQNKLAERKKKWYTSNREKILKRLRHQYAQMPKEFWINKNLKYLYGLSLEEYKKLQLAQNNKCAICKKSANPRLFVDHDHLTNKIRGLLCSKCNLALGQFNDNVDLLLRAVEYLEKFSKFKKVQEMNYAD